MDYASYEVMLPKLRNLEAEVLFILNQAIQEQQIKIHLITSRIKRADSVSSKLERMEAREYCKKIFPIFLIWLALELFVYSGVILRELEASSVSVLT